MSDELIRHLPIIARRSSLVAPLSLIAHCSSLIALLFLAGVAHAACDSTPSCLQALEAAQTSLRTIDAHFTQTKTVSLLTEPIVSTGRFRFKRPDKVRLDIQTPQLATVLIDGRTVSLPGIDAEQMKDMSATPMIDLFTELGALLGGQVNQAMTHFQVHAQADGDGIAVTLTPTLPAWQRLYKRIDMTFGGHPLAIRTMRLDDALGDRLEIAMRDVQRNAELPDAIFTTP
ncbi:MAG: outer membrane lipoprotein carrier protein LolA [Deltaproteobacteria bacterium]|nr:outer membrane lipoprotein carrier protein LolA [Deltaproteobacteria bacterium]